MSKSFRAVILAHWVNFAALRAFGAGLGIGEKWLENRQFELMTADELAEARARGLDIQLHTHRPTKRRPVP